MADPDCEGCQFYNVCVCFFVSLKPKTKAENVLGDTLGPYFFPTPGPTLTLLHRHVLNEANHLKANGRLYGGSGAQGRPPTHSPLRRPAPFPAWLVRRRNLTGVRRRRSLQGKRDPGQPPQPQSRPEPLPSVEIARQATATPASRVLLVKLAGEKSFQFGKLRRLTRGERPLRVQTRTGVRGPGPPRTGRWGKRNDTRTRTRTAACRRAAVSEKPPLRAHDACTEVPGPQTGPASPSAKGGCSRAASSTSKGAFRSEGPGNRF